MSLFKDKIEVEIQEAELATQKSLSRLPGLQKWLLIIVVIGIIPAYYIAKGISLRSWESKYQQTQLTAKPSFTDAKAPVTSSITA